MPTYPLPLSMKRWKAAFWSSSRKPAQRTSLHRVSLSADLRASPRNKPKAEERKPWPIWGFSSRAPPVEYLCHTTRRSQVRRLADTDQRLRSSTLLTELERSPKQTLDKCYNSTLHGLRWHRERQQ